MATNLLKWLPCLTPEDREIIAYAVREGRSKRLTHYAYCRDAANGPELPFLEHELVIDELEHLAQRAFGYKVHDTIRKLKRDPCAHDE
jgi:hypothetical protein